MHNNDEDDIAPNFFSDLVRNRFQHAGYSQRLKTTGMLGLSFLLLNKIVVSISWLE